MKTNIGIVMVVNIVYLFVCFLIIKIRKINKHKVHIWDNGYSFYADLQDSDKEYYWKEDTNIVKLFLALLFLFMEGALLVYVLYPMQLYWIIPLAIGMISCSMVAIRCSLKLQKKYKK